MRFIAVDWGTTNRRAFLIEDGAVIAAEHDDRGAAALSSADYPAEVAGLRGRLGDLPVLIAGMAGSSIGWREARYVAAPADMAALAAALLYVDDRTAIVPGVALAGPGRADVMRGEEVQLLGAVAGGLVPPDALLCQPGTHCKWARMEDGAIADFTTAMTGELFAVLRAHSLLRPQLEGVVMCGDDFAAGVAEGRRRDLAASLFAVRARAVTGIGGDTASFASGVLIGADVAARIVPGDHVHILAGGSLGPLYATAVSACGGTAAVTDSDAAFLAGIIRIRELIR